MKVIFGSTFSFLQLNIKQPLSPLLPTSTANCHTPTWVHRIGTSARREVENGLVLGSIGSKLCLELSALHRDGETCTCILKPNVGDVDQRMKSFSCVQWTSSRDLMGIMVTLVNNFVLHTSNFLRLNLKGSYHTLTTYSWSPSPSFLLHFIVIGIV